MIITIDVKWQAWLPLRAAHITAMQQGKSVDVTYLCSHCNTPHTGVLLSEHPEKLQIQIEVGH